MRFLRRCRVVCTLLAVAVLLVAASGARAQDDIFAPKKKWLGFVATPFLSPANMARAATGVKEKIELIIKARVRFGTSFDVDGFRRRLSRADADFAFIYPTEFALASQSGYLPLVQLESPFKAYFVVPMSSELRYMSDLRGKLVLVPGNGSPVEGLARTALEESGLGWNRDVFIKTLRTDGGCIREMLLGAADACVASRMPTRIIQRELELKLRSIGASAGLPPALFVAHQRVSGENRDKLRRALMSLSGTELGRGRLRQLGIDRLVRFDPSLYRGLDACVDADCDSTPTAAGMTPPTSEPSSPNP